MIHVATVQDNSKIRLTIGDGSGNRPWDNLDTCQVILLIGKLTKAVNEVMELETENGVDHG